MLENERGGGERVFKLPPGVREARDISGPVGCLTGIEEVAFGRPSGLFSPRDHNFNHSEELEF